MQSRRHTTNKTLERIEAELKLLNADQVSKCTSIAKRFPNTKVAREHLLLEKLPSLSAEAITHLRLTANKKRKPPAPKKPKRAARRSVDLQSKTSRLQELQNIFDGANNPNSVLKFRKSGKTTIPVKGRNLPLMLETLKLLCELCQNSDEEACTYSSERPETGGSRVELTADEFEAAENAMLEMDEFEIENAAAIVAKYRHNRRVLEEQLKLNGLRVSEIVINYLLAVSDEEESADDDDSKPASKTSDQTIPLESRSARLQAIEALYALASDENNILGYRKNDADGSLEPLFGQDSNVMLGCIRLSTKLMAETDQKFDEMPPAVRPPVKVQRRLERVVDFSDLAVSSRVKDAHDQGETQLRISIADPETETLDDITEKGLISAISHLKREGFPNISYCTVGKEWIVSW